MLYIVGTPIGNLDDMTFRAIETLKSVDLIASEDTRHTLKLLNHFDIKTPQTSYHEHNKKEKGLQLISKLKSGINIALVSDAGMPAISDPGEDLVTLCVENNIEFTVIPSATAFATALVLSGLCTKSFSFEGFLSAKKSERVAQLGRLKNDTRTLIFYEAPHKLQKTLADMLEVFGDRKIAVCRELTKKFEEVLRDNISVLIEHFNTKEPRGEFVIVVSGAIVEEEIFDLPIKVHVQQFIDAGMDKKDATVHVAKLRGIPKREVYNELIKD